MFLRIVAGLLGLFNGANGLRMVFAPAGWFAATPGVTETGPFNPHFVTDVGFAFVAAGVAFLACAWRPSLRPVALGASGFLALHALYHLLLLFQGHSHHATIDLLVAVPAAIGVAIAWPRRGEA